MSVSTAKLDEAARQGLWGLDVTAAEYVLFHFMTEHKRPTKPYEETSRWPYDDDIERTAAELERRTDLKHGDAMKLASNLCQKLIGRRIRVQGAPS